MDTYDLFLSQNRDWDPSYLAMLFSEDFDDYSDLWSSNVNDYELVQEMNKLEIYAPVVRDILKMSEFHCYLVNLHVSSVFSLFHLFVLLIS